MGGNSSCGGCCGSNTKYEHKLEKLATNRPYEQKHKIKKKNSNVQRYKNSPYDYENGWCDCTSSKYDGEYVSASEMDLIRRYNDKKNKAKEKQKQKQKQNLTGNDNNDNNDNNTNTNNTDDNDNSADIIQQHDDEKLYEIDITDDGNKLVDSDNVSNINPPGNVASSSIIDMDDIKQKENRFSKILKTECLDVLTDLGVLRPIYVPQKPDFRWVKSNHLYNEINMCADLRVNSTENKNNPGYMEMKCFLLKNYEKILKIKPEEMNDFKRIVLEGLGTCNKIYLFSINSSNVDDIFLKEILDVLIIRNKNKYQYGPEVFDMQNIPIKDDGINSLCNYIKQDVSLNLKWLKIGKCYGTYDISDDLCQIFVESLKANRYILRVNIDVQYKYQLQIKKYLDRNIKLSKDSKTKKTKKRTKMTN